MADQKTKTGTESVADFIATIPNETLRKDCETLVEILKKISKHEPVLWRRSIIGFGKYHYKYASGYEGDSSLIGFSPGKDKISLYLMPGFAEETTLLPKLGKYKAGKGCLYIKKLDDINLSILKELAMESIDGLKKRYPDNSK
jgi:hypothetical protein